MLREQALLRPDAIALRQKRFGIWSPITWSDYYRRALHVGLGLRAAGLGDARADAEGDDAGRNGHVAILSENRIEWVLTQMGAGVVGAVTVGVYPTSPTDEVAYVLEHADAEIVVCEDQEQADKVIEARERLPRLRKIVVMEHKGLRDVRALDPECVMSFDELEALGAACAANETARTESALATQRQDEIALLIYTSGSTGKPKGAMISYANVAAMAHGAADRLRLDEHTAHLSYLPLCHVAEQMMTSFVPVYVGSQVAFGESIRTVQEDLREIAPTVFLGVPRVWEKLHSAIAIKTEESGKWRASLFARCVAACEPFCEKAPGQRSFKERAIFGAAYWFGFRALQNFVGLRKVRIALTGAAPISPAIVRFFRTLGVPLIEVYGLTESSGMVIAQRADHVRVGTVGIAIEGIETRLSEQGELQLRGAAIFRGYYKNPEATREAIVDGWLHTGDVVEQCDDGQLRIVDRIKDIMITAGGKNLTPSAIENTMKASPFIKECVVIADARRFVAALIQIDLDSASQWAERRQIAFTNFKSLAEHDDVRALIEREIDAGNRTLAPVSQIRRFHLLTRELDHDDGEVTATMKVRRASIYKTYAADIDAMYR